MCFRCVQVTSLIHQICINLQYNQEPANAQQSFSATREPTVWRVIPVLEYLQQTWQNMADSSKFDAFSTAINCGLDNIRKWYHKIDETDVYFICLGTCCIYDNDLLSNVLFYYVLLALDPNYKVAYAKGKWEPRDFHEGMKCLQKVFDKYYHHTSLPDTESAVVAPPSLARQGSYGHSWMRDAVHSRVMSDTANRRPRQELDDYLAAPLEDVENIVAWWGVSFFCSYQYSSQADLNATVSTILFNIPLSLALPRITLPSRALPSHLNELFRVAASLGPRAETVCCRQHLRPFSC